MIERLSAISRLTTQHLLSTGTRVESDIEQDIANMVNESQSASLLQGISSFQPASLHTLDDLLTMPLAKFSYATTLNLSSRLTWKHLPERDNIFAVFDVVKSKGLAGRIKRQDVLKVVKGGEVLVCYHPVIKKNAFPTCLISNHALCPQENIDLELLRRQAGQDEDSAGSVHLLDSQRRVVVLVRSPLVAIRYPLLDGQVGRVKSSNQ